MGADETFRKNGPWIESSRGFKVRALGRAGMEYIRGQLILQLNAEALATNAFMIYPTAFPAGEREHVLDDVTRAWLWAGFEIQVLGS